MQSAEAATPAPTYGTFASSSRPWTVPSSPNGPCRTGSTTSTEPSAAAGFESASTGSVSRTGTCLVTALLLGPSERPAAVAADRDRASSRSAPDRAPPARNGPRRARSRARSSARRRRRRRGCALLTESGSWSWSRRAAPAAARSGRRRSPPTCPARRRCRPPGSCESTRPSRVWSSTISSTTCTSKPDCCSCARASASVWLVTSGTCEVCGPVETWSVITDPLLCCVPAAGFWPTTVPAAAGSSTSSRATAKPTPWSEDCARLERAARSRSAP